VKKDKTYPNGKLEDHLDGAMYILDQKDDEFAMHQPNPGQK
jgi:hypothetical protein